MTPLELLRAGKARIETLGWCQGDENALFSQSRGVCAGTALPYTDENAMAALRILKRANGLPPDVGIAEWNDAPERTLTEVLAAYDKAIALAEQETHHVS